METPWEIIGHYSFDTMEIFLSFSGHALSVEVQTYRRWNIAKITGDRNFRIEKSLLLF